MSDPRDSHATAERIARFEAALVSRVGQQRHSLWFAGHAAISLSGRELTIAVSSETFLKWLEQTFGNDVRSVASEVSGGEWTVRFSVQKSADELAADAIAEVSCSDDDTPTIPFPPLLPPPTRTLFGDEHPPAIAPDKRKPKSTGEAPVRSGRRWRTLADFVVGPCNRVARAAAQSAIEEPGECANPLVLHGPSGTGKTHLLEAIFAGIRKRDPQSRPVLLTGEEFTTRFVQACRYDRQAQFRRQTREASAFLIDDLHFLASKPRSQEEMMHAIEALIAEDRQVVVAMDCHPRLADELLPELVDRLYGGAIWPLQPFDDETRLEFLRRKGTSGLPPIGEAALGYMARNIRGNARELEGAIHSVKHFARVTEKPIDIPLVREALGDLLRHAVRTIALADVDEAVCSVLQLGKGTLQSKQRIWAVTHPRMIAVYLARKHTVATYGEIAKHFGAKTHSTAVAAEKKVKQWLKAKANVSIGPRSWPAVDLVERIERELQN